MNRCIKCMGLYSVIIFFPYYILYTLYFAFFSVLSVLTCLFFSCFISYFALSNCIFLVEYTRMSSIYCFRLDKKLAFLEIFYRQDLEINRYMDMSRSLRYSLCGIWISHAHSPLPKCFRWNLDFEFHMHIHLYRNVSGGIWIHMHIHLFAPTNVCDVGYMSPNIKRLFTVILTHK